jgi:hypothetical protein
MKKATCYLNPRSFDPLRRKIVFANNPYLMVTRILAVFPALTTLMT